jgi:hypothetical protein
MRNKEEIQKKIQQRIMKAQQGHMDVQGTHLYTFENHRNHDLSLPRRSYDGKTLIPPRGQFKGDEYFLMLQKSGQIRLVSSEPFVKPQPVVAAQVQQPVVEKVEVIKENLQENTMEKLILDQPDRVTVQGHSEQVACNQPKQINDASEVNAKAKQSGEVLLTENPLDGVDIITG